MGQGENARRSDRGVVLRQPAPRCVRGGDGVALLILWTLTMMALLSWADLSYVLPVTAIGYVLTALSGKYLLGENVSIGHWAGIFLITSGVILVGLTAPVTAAKQVPQ